MKRFASLACATVFAALLAGCSSNASRTYGSAYPSYDPVIPRPLGVAGPLQVSLTGSPFAQADVIGAMNAVPNVHGLKFGPDANPAQFGYRIVLNFAANTSNPCNAETVNSLPFDADPSTIRVVAGFCRFGSTVSRTSGMAQRPPRADDPEFRRFMQALVVELLPAFKPHGVENGDCPNRVNC